jgi:hypothetical protein
LLAIGVAHNPKPVAAVGGVNGNSRNSERPNGVSCTFQVSHNRVEFHSDEANNVFSNDPSGPLSFDDFKHCRPEMTVILRAQLLPGV